MKIEIKLQRIVKQCENKDSIAKLQIIENEASLIEERIKRIASKRGLTAKNAEMITAEKATLLKNKKLIKNLINVI